MAVRQTGHSLLSTATSCITSKFISIKNKFISIFDSAKNLYLTLLNSKLQIENCLASNAGVPLMTNAPCLIDASI